MKAVKFNNIQSTKVLIKIIQSAKVEGKIKKKNKKKLGSSIQFLNTTVTYANSNTI